MLWAAHERNLQFGENKSINIGKSQKLCKQGNARINKVSTMRTDLAKIINKVPILSNFECPQTTHLIAANTCCIDYTDFCCSKQVHGLSKSQSTNRSTINYRSENTVELDTAVG
jgi:hypothetical protein